MFYSNLLRGVATNSGLGGEEQAQIGTFFVS